MLQVKVHTDVVTQLLYIHYYQLWKVTILCSEVGHMTFTLQILVPNTGDFKKLTNMENKRTV